MLPHRPASRAAVAALALSAASGICAPARAQVFDAPTVLEDARLYVTAPLRWDRSDWALFGTTLAAVAVAHEVDDSVRSHFVTDPGAGLGDDEADGTRDALPMAALLAGTAAYAVLIGSRDGYYETGTMLEATVFAGASTLLLKTAIGRDRPYDTTDPDRWFAGGDAFPSGHASLAFAIGTVFAESGSDRYRWIRRVLGYGAAGLTAWRRIDGNAHWSSDVVAGAALGFSTAQFVMNRRDRTRRRVMTNVVPLADGAMVSWGVPLR